MTDAAYWAEEHGLGRVAVLSFERASPGFGWGRSLRIVLAGPKVWILPVGLFACLLSMESGSNHRLLHRFFYKARIVLCLGRGWRGCLWGVGRFDDISATGRIT